MVEIASSTLEKSIKASVNYLNFYYGGTVHALKDINLLVGDKQVTALIGIC